MQQILKVNINNEKCYNIEISDENIRILSDKINNLTKKRYYGRKDRTGKAGAAGPAGKKIFRRQRLFKG